MKLKRGASCGGTRPQQQQFSASPVYTKSEKEASVVAINLINSNANNFPVCIAFYSFLCSGHMTTPSNQNWREFSPGDWDNSLGLGKSSREVTVARTFSLALE